jgi:membrane protease YdiL (CAAX protease family)
MAPSVFSTALRAFAIALPGIALLPFVVEPPEGIPAVLLMVNPLVLTLVMCLAGAATAPRLGLAAEWILGSTLDLAILRLGLVTGLVGGLLAAVIDQFSAPLWQTADLTIPTLLDGAGPMQLILGVLYGGLTEEIMLRWGLLSLLFWALAKALPRGAACWIAVIAAAFLFAAGHLPAVLASGAELAPALLIRILGLNAALGIVYGLLYVRKSLGAAMAAHAGTHLAVFLLGLVW